MRKKIKTQVSHYSAFSIYYKKDILEGCVMGRMIHPLTENCDFAGVKPILVDLPYPPLQVKEKNQAYANLLSIDYCGAISEMSAIAQYINDEGRLFHKQCPAAKTILGIAMAEMMHLQKLGELIILLGGTLDFVAKHHDGKRKMWTPGYLPLSENAEKMMLAGIEAERATIDQYKMHMRMIHDKDVNAVLARIIKDEEYHIMILQALRQEL